MFYRVCFIKFWKHNRIRRLLASRTNYHSRCRPGKSLVELSLSLGMRSETGPEVKLWNTSHQFTSYHVTWRLLECATPTEMNRRLLLSKFTLWLVLQVTEYESLNLLVLFNVPLIHMWHSDRCFTSRCHCIILIRIALLICISPFFCSLNVHQIEIHGNSMSCRITVVEWSL